MTTNRKTPDGRSVVALSQAPDGWSTFITGRADDPAALPPARKAGTGTDISMSFAAPGTQQLDIALAEPVYLHNGQVYFSGTWDLTDRFSLYASIPATAFDAGGNLDVVSVPIGPGVFAWKHVTPGSGSHSFDQTKANPVPTPDPDIGWWNVDLSNSNVMPVENVSADWALLSFQVEAYFLNSVPINGTSFDTEMYQSEWISQKWILRWNIVKSSSGAGVAAAWIFTFRQTR